MERETERLDTIAQRLVHAPRFAWRPNMLARDASGFWMRGKPAPGSALFPDLLDPPTIGYLAAMVIEAYAEHQQLVMHRDRSRGWTAVASMDGNAVANQIHADSFAELLALLIEAAE